MGYFTKEVLELLGVWGNGKLDKPHAWKNKVSFFCDFWHWVKGLGFVRKNASCLKFRLFHDRWGLARVGIEFYDWDKSKR